MTFVNWINLRSIDAQSFDCCNGYLHYADWRGLDLSQVSLKGRVQRRAHSRWLFPKDLGLQEIILTVADRMRLRSIK